MRQQETASISISINHRLREGLLIILIALAAYLFIAFITYHSSDPGWSNSGNGGFVLNAGGKVGAWLADVFLYLFGYMAYLFPAILALAAWLVLYGRLHNLEFKLWHFIFRFIGFVITLIAGCSLMNLYLSNWQVILPMHAGGVLGVVIAANLINILNNAGSALILFAFFLIGIVLSAGISWVHLFAVVGKTGLRFCGWIRSRCAAWWDRIRDRRAKQLTFSNSRRPNKVVVRDKPQPIKPVQEPIFHKVQETKPKQAKKTAQNSVPITGTFPSLSLLDKPQKTKDAGYSQSQLEELSRNIEQRLLDFGIEAYVVAVHPGPVITRFELELAPGLKVSRITSLVKDLARSLSMVSVRVVEVIPGKSVIGLEVPNKSREFVCLRELFESKQYIEATSSLSLVLGKNIAGYPIIVDLTKMPHLLVCGTTGSGKSVGLNAMIFSMLYKATPAEVRFIMVDPKMLELSVYDGIPHLLTPVVTNMKEAANAFRWCVAEMERRFQLMAFLRVRNIAGYNAKIAHAIENGEPIVNPLIPAEQQAGEPETLQKLPYIVVIVDELSDMMMVVGKKVEELIARLAQKARAAGIHMILATQRPSVDVITGLIKSNIPTRIAFQVSSKIDSRTILDQQGAEQLLGSGDMLYLPPGAGLPTRVHGAYVSDGELQRVIADWKKRGEPEYLEEVLQDRVDVDANGAINGESDAEQDPLYDQAVHIVTETRRASISYVQRRLKIGYNRAARILEAMEQAGVVSQMENNGAREVLAPPPPEES
jgi:S-DNA-T family DNA segregation ATPase FtsK/SpoIIIE